jgi:hypothetical protein
MKVPPGSVDPAKKGIPGKTAVPDGAREKI